jgi:hypothetical protein
MSHRVGVALSGGGHRASLFAAGVLQYLADAGVNRDVSSIASVSGGSLTNAFVGQQLDFRSVDGPTFQAQVTGPLLRQIALDGTLFATRRSKIYLAALVLLGVIGLVVPWFVPIPWYLRLGWFVVGLLLLGALAGLRGRICTAAFRDTLFSSDGRPSSLAVLDRSVDHVLCATDLRSGDHVYFSGRLVYGYRFGIGTPGDLDLAVAAHASAALPGAFPPVRLPTARHRFTGRPPTPGLDEDPSQLVLVDGGVYDNMADQWGSGHRDREARLPEHFADRWPTVLVVANASSGMTWAPFRWSRVPIVNEVLALLRDKSILYDNTTAHRRRALIERFDQAEQLGEGQRGVYVGIEQSPYRVAQVWRAATGTWAGRAERARRVLDVLDAAGRSSDEWTSVARSSASASTNLSRLDADAAASLVHHAYVTTMCNLHVVLDLPLLDVPSDGRFRALVADR